MRDEYDFSKAERGKFYRPDITLKPPVYLEAEIFDYLAEKAKAKGVPVDEMINELLRKDIAEGI